MLFLWIADLCSAHLPSLERVRGDVRIQSDNNGRVCHEVPALESSQTCNISVPSSSPSVTPSSSHGLSEGAIIGIAVGVAVPCGAIFCAALGVLFWRRRKSHQWEQASSSVRQPTSSWSSPPDKECHEVAAHRETDAQARELPTRANTHELRVSRSKFLAEIE